LIADGATFALKAGLWVRLVRFVMFAPDPRQHCRRQAEIPPIGLSEFPRPPLYRRATTETDAPGASDAATISRLSASGHNPCRRLTRKLVSIFPIVDTS